MQAANALSLPLATANSSEREQEQKKSYILFSRAHLLP